MQIQSNTSLLIVFRVGISTKNWESPTILRKVWFFPPVTFVTNEFQNSFYTCSIEHQFLPLNVLLPGSRVLTVPDFGKTVYYLHPQEAHPTVSVNHLQAPQQTLLLQIQEIYAPRYPSVTTISFFSTPCYIGSLGDSASYSLAAFLGTVSSVLPFNCLKLFTQ